MYCINVFLKTIRKQQFPCKNNFEHLNNFQRSPVLYLNTLLFMYHKRKTVIKFCYLLKRVSSYQCLYSFRSLPYWDLFWLTVFWSSLYLNKFKWANLNISFRYLSSFLMIKVGWNPIKNNSPWKRIDFCWSQYFINSKFLAICFQSDFFFLIILACFDILI